MKPEVRFDKDDLPFLQEQLQYHCTEGAKTGHSLAYQRYHKYHANRFRKHIEVILDTP